MTHLEKVYKSKTENFKSLMFMSGESLNLFEILFDRHFLRNVFSVLGQIEKWFYY